uniref:PWWP domain-containing protein n=1 Tax=Oryza punctata TaxID=4537 RepID=A0A0E0L6K8_ORYPU
MGDVSWSEGTLVWVRRPNGSWWPGRVISPVDVPDGCPAPPKAPATPIMLLGRRQGPTFVDWCNLERSKRVKPFRCGESEFDDCIAKAQTQDALRRSTTTTTTTTTGNKNKNKRDYNTGRYARKEDAILQALQIERACFQDAHTESTALNLPMSTTQSSHAAQPPSPTPNRKRKTPNDSEDDAPHCFPRMRDLSDIGSNTFPNRLPTLSHHLPTACPVKRSRQSNATTKRKQPTPHPDHLYATARKKDRSRPLSELCNGDMWNGFKPNAPAPTCSTSSSGTSILDTVMEKCSSHRDGASKEDKSKMSCMTSLPAHDFSHGNTFAATSLLTGSIFAPDHLKEYEPPALVKDPICRRKRQGTNCGKARCDRRNFTKQIISSADLGPNNVERNALEPGYHKDRVVKHRASIDKVILLEENVGKSSLNKPTGPDGGKQLAVFSTGLDCDGAVKQQCSKVKQEHEESSEILSSPSNCENVSASSLVFEVPLQVLPPERKTPRPARCRAVKPTKTLQLNPILYDVELSGHGCTNKGRRVPLVSLMSRWNRRPVVGYPVSVEVSDGVCFLPASGVNDHRPATSTVNGLVKKDEAASPGRLRSHTGGAKPKIRRKMSELETEKSWRPHTKNHAPSSRKMRRLSSFEINQRGAGDKKSVVGKISGPTIACIPLRVVFSRINEALSFQMK